MLTLAEQKQIANALIDAEEGVERRIHEMHRLSGRIEYYRGRVDAIKMIQKTVSGEQDVEPPDEEL
jgi:hypothetical protein